MMLMILLVLGIVFGINGNNSDSNKTWYQGCYPLLDSDINTLRAAAYGSIVSCAEYCNNQGYLYIGVQMSEELDCVCWNGTLGQETNVTCCDTSGPEKLAVGVENDCWAVYMSIGPFLTTLSIEADTDVVIVNRMVSMEMTIERAAALNVTEDNPELGSHLDIVWQANGDNTTYKDDLDLLDYTEIYHRLRYTFQQVGFYTVDVKVSNGISALSASLDLEVVYPSPHDLQVGIQDDLYDPPSCIPNEFNVNEDTNQVLAVFVNTSVHLEASVSMGTNLTFSFWFEDSSEMTIIEPCVECTSALQNHTFQKTGMFTIVTNVTNEYGTLQKNITLTVIDKQLSDLKIMVHPDSSSITTIEDPVFFTVSMVTTTRSNIFLQVWYGDGHNNVVSISDTNSPALVLTGNGKDMNIIASYGEGCELVVEFKYVFNEAGLYRPKVALLDESDGKKYLKSAKKVKDEPDFNKKFNNINFPPTNEIEKHYGPGFELYARVAESLSSDQGHSRDYQFGQENSNIQDSVLLSSELEMDVLVVVELIGLQIQANRTARCNEKTDFHLQLGSKFNLSVHWLIYRFVDDFYLDIDDNNDDDVIPDIEFVTDFNETSTYFGHVFSQVGVYIISAEVQNALSFAQASTNIIIQCPIKGLFGRCLKDILETGSEIFCTAEVDHGSDVVFIWTIEGREESRYIQYENYTSTIRHQFHEAGEYNITIEAYNNISSQYVFLPVVVLDPVTHITVIKQYKRTLLGNMTTIVAFQSMYYYCNFVFDFGNGEEHVPTICRANGCFVQKKYLFSTPGKHAVTVYAYNDVSEIVKRFDIWVFPPLDEVSVEAIGTVMVGSPTKFRVKERGNTMATENVYFTWRLGVAGVYFTNSPIVEVVFRETGSQSIKLTVTNPVVSEVFDVGVDVRSRSEVNLQLLHDLYVTPDDQVDFKLKGPLIGWNKLLVSYSDRQSETYQGVTYQWSHQFKEVGAHQINVTLVGVQGTSIEVVTSYVMVEVPITGLYLEGPQAAAVDKYEERTWWANMASGSHVVYNWTLEENIITTSPEYETVFEFPGKYTLYVVAYNDVTAPITASLPIIVEYPIRDINLEIFGDLVGSETLIEVTVPGGQDFHTDLKFGDGDEIQVSSQDRDLNITDDRDSVPLYLTHVYRETGAFTVFLNVSNSISYITYSEVFVPIANVTLSTRSPWLIQTPGRVIVMATVKGGRDLIFSWNFSDDFEKLSDKRYPNQTSKATYEYGMSGEYQVAIEVTGTHYPPPGIQVTLPRNFTVVDPIDVLKLTLQQGVDKNYATLEGNRTRTVVFTAMSTGSHVKFLFKFGDGTSTEVLGTQLPAMSVVMTMQGQGRHVYTEVGEYKVEVTAMNPLGNRTVHLSKLFYVQHPPKSLFFCDGESGVNLSGYFSGLVGETISLCAAVLSGTDVTFDWKLGDQTDIVKAGSSITHKYHSPGVRTVYVTAKNKVKQLEREIPVYINYEIQGVELLPESRVVALGQAMLYEAVVRPNYTNIVDRCSAKVIAQNKISNATSASVDIYVIAKIEKLQISVLGNKTERLVNQPIRFQYFVYLGSDLNLTWSFGDGSSPLLTNAKEVEHTFDREDGFNITLTASNRVSSQTVSSMLFVLSKSYCNKPSVRILNQPRTKVLYSKPFTVEADVVTDCNLTSVVSYDWSIDGHMTRNDSEMHKRVLVLPPRVLHYGRHVIKFKVNMKDTIVFNTDVTYIEVIASALVSKIRGGVYRWARHQDPIKLDGSESYDPDVAEKGHLSYSWICRYMMDSANHGTNCFHSNETHNASCEVAMNTPLVVFPGYCLIDAANFTFELTVFSEGRQNDTSFQVLDIFKDEGNILQVEILRPYATLDLINEDRKLSFSAVCRNCIPGRTHYKWTLKHLPDENIFNLARAHDLSCVLPDGASYQAIKLEEKMEEERQRVEEDRKREEAEEIKRQQQLRWDDLWKDGRERGDLRGVGNDSILDELSTKSTYPFDQIKEGNPSIGINHRRRRGSPVENREETTTRFEYPVVKEVDLAGSRVANSRIPPSHDISENMDQMLVRRPTHANTIPLVGIIKVSEGSPGESGSSGGRQFPNVAEGASSGRFGSDTGIQEVEKDAKVSQIDALLGVKSDKNRKRTILDQRPFPAHLVEEQTKTGLTSQSLVIKPGTVKQGWTYVVQVNVYNEDDGTEGEAMSSFKVNESPTYGSCTIKPESGIAMDTEFNVHCKGWKDKHVPLMYEVGYNQNESRTDSNLIYRGVDNEFSFKLPAGTGKRNQVFVYIDILDALLAKTSVCWIAIQVRPRSTAAPFNVGDGVLRGTSHAQLIYAEVNANDSALQTYANHGDDALSKVYISYLATWLNTLSDNVEVEKNTTTVVSNFSMSSDSAERTNVSDVDKTGDDYDWRTEWQYRVDTRTKLLTVLKTLPTRDEAEVIQSAQALAYLTAVPDELSQIALDVSLKILKSISQGVERVYRDGLAPTGDLIALAVKATSSIIKATLDMAKDPDKTIEETFKKLINGSVEAVRKLILNELKFHMVSEEPINSSTEYFSVLAWRHSADKNQLVQIKDTTFKLPQNLDHILQQKRNQSKESVDRNCFQSHMTSFKRNPYSFDANKVNTIVSGLRLYDCDGVPLLVDGLLEEERIHVQLPNIPPRGTSQSGLVLKKWAMNIHQFNITNDNLHHALHLVVEFVHINKGRLFPVTVLLSFLKAPSPHSYQYKFDFTPNQNTLDIFLPAGSFNASGIYYIGLVDTNYNAGRLRPGEVTARSYTLKLWWGECLYWNTLSQAWLPNGCWISQHSTFQLTKCECNHLTAFGGRFELIPNDLALVDVEIFFSPNRNPITSTLISMIVILYFVLFLWCRHADQHDAKKGGIVYLLDNAPMDQQKYEITLETGIRKDAGTTAKISLILHGEEGMSETRELISEDDRPMFERNSRDKFILTVPDSIGRIWKVQIWHNNFGESPSWYLSRVIVRDLNTGHQYFFLCEKWLAVEEQDGKVEREFMSLDGPLEFGKAFVSKAVEYVADFHIWMSLVTCPPYSGFMRTERLTVCLSMLMMYMCLNAVWYKTTVTEYRGEFGLLDLSWRNVMVGTICCAVVIPVSLMLEFLFRRSKPKHASSCHSKDEVSEWDHDYPSGKPNEQEHEDSSEHVPPVMTYSLLDQSILNWPNIQTWAQKLWMKRQQSVRSNQDSNSGSSVRSDHSVGNLGIMKPSADLTDTVFSEQGLCEMDQASSGFEDCSSLIRPKASVDSTHTTAAPSVAESMRTHKPPSLSDSMNLSKPVSEFDSTKTSKAASISSSGSTFHKGSVSTDKRERYFSQLYLPYWCRYIAWILCGLICVGCATVTVMYGYRFGITKSTLWLQSLYFSFMICVFISNPILILIVIVYSAVQYKKDPTAIHSYSYDIFNREKAKEDLLQWKKQMELWEEGEALERGVAARQRSRYLRFARPPQEKQLIEARKRVMKEKKALAIFRESVAFIIAVFLLLIMAYGKDAIPTFQLNSALKNRFQKSGNPTFTNIQSRDQWYYWAGTSLLDGVNTLYRLDSKAQSSNPSPNMYILGNIQLRQQRVQSEACPVKLPYVSSSCLGNTVSSEMNTFSDLLGLSYTSGHRGNFIFGKHGIYDGSGFILSLNRSRSEALTQINFLKHHHWLDRQTGAVFVEFTLYNAATNLFTAVNLLVEMSSAGDVSTVVKVSSTQIFRYVTTWDNVVLASELLFFVIMMFTVKSQALRIVELKQKYFTLPWNVLNFIICIVSLVFCTCYVYRFVIVSCTVESLRSTYYEKYVDVSFITFWDEVLRSAVAVILFLSLVKCLRLLRYNKQFAVFGDVYRKARREVVIFFAMFVTLIVAYSSLGNMLFGSVFLTFRDLWSSLLGVTALLTRKNIFPEFQNQGQRTATNIFLFTFCVFALGFLTTYMVAVLSHYFKSRKKRRLLAMSGMEAILFYWQHFRLWTGLQKKQVEEEPIIILPPEFTMAEIEYQVDELLFRMNALTGSHGLPEKPPCYLTDSDCTYGGGDDGISSGGSEPGQFGEDRLEQRVQKIEDNLCSQEPFLAQLLKFDSVGADDLSHEKEKQLRSHLELEIFRQLQIQRQDLKSPSAEENVNKGSNQDYKQGTDDMPTPNSPGHDSTSSEELVPKPPTKPRRTRSHLTVQTIQDLITKSAQEMCDSRNDVSSSNPDSPRDKITFAKMRKNIENQLKSKNGTNNKQHGSSTSSTEKISPDLSLNHTYMSETDNIRKPTKPTFLHSRESSLSDAPKGSPILKIRKGIPERGMRADLHPHHPTGIERLLESSSGSEQDGVHIGRKLLAKRSLRKTKSRGKGKGIDSLEPAFDGLEPVMVLDEVDGEEGEEGDFDWTGDNTADDPPEGFSTLKCATTEHTVMADVHQSGDLVQQK